MVAGVLEEAPGVCSGDRSQRSTYRLYQDLLAPLRCLAKQPLDLGEGEKKGIREAAGVQAGCPQLIVGRGRPLQDYRWHDLNCLPGQVICPSTTIS